MNWTGVANIHVHISSREILQKVIVSKYLAVVDGTLDNTMDIMKTGSANVIAK